VAEAVYLALRHHQGVFYRHAVMTQIAVVIPAYNESKHIAGVLARLPPEITYVIVVDDASDDNTADIVHQVTDVRVSCIRHACNQGVGGAVCSGYKRALALGADIVVKVDGDGQMDTSRIASLIAPIVQGRADYAKGARFSDRTALRQMPRARLLGNLILSVAAKFVTGYWNILDPANGFTAIHRQALAQLPLHSLNRGYFFETDMLIHLYYLQAVVADVPMPACYGEEHSKRSPLKGWLAFPQKLLRAYSKRMVWRYFRQDFTAGTLFLVLGLLLCLSGVSFGVVACMVHGIWGHSMTTKTTIPAIVPVMLGLQLLLQALIVDLHGVPRTPIHTKSQACHQSNV
jgi:dolichol-phosphate mannosyltransferase